MRSKTMSVTAMEMMVSVFSAVLYTTQVSSVGTHVARNYG